MSQAASLSFACDAAPCGMSTGGTTMDAGMEFYRCQTCGVLRIPPEKLLHQSVDSDPLTPLSLVMRLLMTMRMIWLRLVVPALRDKRTTIADVGCGDGQFSEFLKRSGYHVTGIEPEDDRREHAQARGLEVYPSWAAADQARGQEVQADIAITWHVLEHVPQPAGFLKELTSRVRPGGSAIISVPNQNSLQTRLFGFYSSYPDYGRHVWYHEASYADYIRKAAGGAEVRLLPDYNLEYEVFAWVDSILSAIVRRQNFVHIALKKGKGPLVSRLLIAVAAVAVLPLAGVLSLVSLAMGRGSTLTFEIRPKAG
jgi:SAM-dependent methyltransferase